MTHRRLTPLVSLISLADTQASFASSPGRTLKFRHHTMTADATPERLPICCEVQDSRIPSDSKKPELNGDLNNTASERVVPKSRRHHNFAYQSLSIPACVDDAIIRSKYRPFLLPDLIGHEDWVSQLELATVTEMAYNDLKLTSERIKVLVLYGSLRQR